MKKILALLLIFVIAFSAVACGKTEEVTPTADTTESTYPVTVKDQLGREVVIEKEPETLVSGYYISTSVLIALGLEDKLVGIEAKADTRPIYKLSAPELLELPSVGTAKEFDLEGCAALEPDLVILPAKLKDVIPSLEELGITVIAVNPEDDSLLAGTIGLLGTATNTVERADQLEAYINAKFTEVETALYDAPTRNMYISGNSSFLSAAGAEMYQNSIIECVSGYNVASLLSGNDWSEISYEQLLSWSPTHIIIAANADYTVDDVLKDTNIAECIAVRAKQVYQFPNTIEAWDSPVPGSVIGVCWLASVLHPDLYTPEQYEQTVVEFYETFYDFTPEI